MPRRRMIIFGSITILDAAWITTAGAAVGVSTYLVPLSVSLVTGAFLLAATALGAYLAAKWRTDTDADLELKAAQARIAELEAEAALREERRK